MDNKPMTKEEAAVAEVVEQWRATFEASNAEGMMALWDRDHPRLTYLPTERETAMTTWAEIQDYYDRVCGSLTVNEWRTWDVIADVISDTSAFAFAHTDFSYQSKNEPEAGDQYWEGRISFHLHRKGGRWLIIHYEDSTLMQWMLPLVAQFQRPVLERLRQSVESGDSAGAIELLRSFETPIAFSALTAIAERRT